MCCRPTAGCRRATGRPRTARRRPEHGLPVDLRVVEPDNFGNLLQHFTGSAAHNVALREAAVRRGLHVSEYGILDDETGETLRCATEEEVYARLGLEYPEPELRENRGELAADFVAPQLVAVDDLKGDLHMHTIASDGRDTIEGMARAALARWRTPPPGLPPYVVRVAVATVVRQHAPRQVTPGTAPVRGPPTRPALAPTPAPSS